MGTVGKNHPCSKEYLEQQKNRRSKNVPSKPVKSKPNSCMARSLPIPERLQRPVLTNFSSYKPSIPFPLDLLPRLPGASANPPGTAAVAQEQPSAPPATEQEPAAQTFAFAGPNVYSQTFAFAGPNVYSQPTYPGDQASGTQSAPGAHGCHQGTNQSRRSPQSCGFSCNSPHIKQLFQEITSRLLHFSSVATRASITFFCAIALFCILSSLPGFLIHFTLYLVLATSLLGLPMPVLLAAHVIYSVVTFLHPLCALILLLPCFHRLHVRRLPLANWSFGFPGANAAWTDHRHQGHQHQQ